MLGGPASSRRATSWPARPSRGRRACGTRQAERNGGNVRAESAGSASSPRPDRASRSCHSAGTSRPCSAQSSVRSHHATNSSNESCAVAAWVSRNSRVQRLWSSTPSSTTARSRCGRSRRTAGRGACRTASVERQLSLAQGLSDRVEVPHGLARVQVVEDGSGALPAVRPQLAVEPLVARNCARLAMIGEGCLANSAGYDVTGLLPPTPRGSKLTMSNRFCSSLLNRPMPVRTLSTPNITGPSRTEDHRADPGVGAPRHAPSKRKVEGRPVRVAPVHGHTQGRALRSRRLRVAALAVGRGEMVSVDRCCGPRLGGGYAGERHGHGQRHRAGDGLLMDIAEVLERSGQSLDSRPMALCLASGRTLSRTRVHTLERRADARSSGSPRHPTSPLE